MNSKTRTYNPLKSSLAIFSKCLCLLFVLCTALCLHAQTECFDKYNNLSFSYKYAVLEDSLGRIIISTDRLSLVILDGYDAQYFHTFDKKLNEVYSHVKEMKWMENGDLFISVVDQGSMIIKPDTVIKYLTDEAHTTGLYNRKIEAFAQRGDTLIVGCEDSNIYAVDINSGAIVRQLNILEKFPYIRKDGVPRGDIFDIKQDIHNSCIYWVLGHGLFRYDFCKNKIKHFPQGENFILDQYNGSEKTHNEYGMYQIEQYRSKIFCSSWGGGIVAFDTLDKTWERNIYEPYTDEDVLDENVVINMTRINDTILYGTSLNHPVFLNMNTQKWISSNAIIIGGLGETKAAGSDLFVSGSKAFVGDADKFCVYNVMPKFQKPETIKKHPYIFSMYADGVNLNHAQSIYPSFTSNIEHEFRNIRIDFRYPFPANKDSIEYEYQLQGYDSDWVNIGSEHTIQYNQLGGGNYSLHVRARETPSAEWVNLSEPFQFTIEKILIEKWWFRILMIIISGGILYALFYFFRKQQREKQQLQLQHLSELQEVQLSALRAQINPHFLFNSLTSINNYIMYENPRKASRYLTKFSHLMRKILNYSSQNMISIEEEFQILKLYAEMENARFDNKFTIAFHVDQPILPTSTFIPSMILQPFIENAIHHGMNHKDGKGEIVVHISPHQDDQIRISIKDDGIGREKAMKIKENKSIKNRSMGIDITNKRMELINDLFDLHTEISINDLKSPQGEAIGTEVLLLLPLVLSTNRKNYEVHG